MKQQLSILFPWQDRVVYEEMKESAWHDLGLDAVVDKVARQPQEAVLIRRVMTSLTDDPAVSAYRADVFEDILGHPDIRERMLKLLEQVKTFYDYGVVNRGMGDESGIWDLMHRLEEYHEYILTVEAIRECLSDHDLKSEGLTVLRDTVDTLYRDQGFAALKKDVESMRLTALEMKSITVGINLNDRFEAVSMGLIAINKKPFSRSGLLKNFIAAVSSRDDLNPEADWNGGFSFYPANSDGGLFAIGEQIAETSAVLHNPLAFMSLARIPAADGLNNVPRQMDSAATVLASKIARRLKDLLGKYLNVSVKAIADLIPELLFYTRWAEYIESCRAKGWPFCKPVTAAQGAGMTAEGFYNLKLIGGLEPSAVTLNSLAFDREKRVYILTGANRGGKTTVTQAVGQLYLLAQSGLFVPGQGFSFAPVDRVLTHFPADEDQTMDLGRLGEECKRFRELYGEATGSSLILLNETFSTTSFEEGYYIAVDAVRAILRKGCRTIYNTHMHKLAYDLDAVINPGSGEGKALSLVAETKDGKNSFRIRVAPPEGKSFARDIAEKYGVTYEALTEA